MNQNCSNGSPYAQLAVWKLTAFLGFIPRRPTLPVLFKLVALSGGYLSLPTRRQKNGQDCLLAGDGELVQYPMNMQPRLPRKKISSVNLGYQHQKSSFSDHLAVENTRQTGTFPQLGGIHCARLDSVEKSPHSRGIRDGFRQTPRILLMSAGDGDHSGTAESRSM